VARRSPLSFEYHPDSLVEEEDFVDFDSEDKDCEDPFIALMAKVNIKL